LWPSLKRSVAVLGLDKGTILFDIIWFTADGADLMFTQDFGHTLALRALVCYSTLNLNEQ